MSTRCDLGINNVFVVLTDRGDDGCIVIVCECRERAERIVRDGLALGDDTRRIEEHALLRRLTAQELGE